MQGGGTGPQAKVAALEPKWLLFSLCLSLPGLRLGLGRTPHLARERAPASLQDLDSWRGFRPPKLGFTKPSRKQESKPPNSKRNSLSLALFALLGVRGGGSPTSPRSRAHPHPRFSPDGLGCTSTRLCGRSERGRVPPWGQVNA